jgi:hypothetical protein
VPGYGNFSPYALIAVDACGFTVPRKKQFDPLHLQILTTAAKQGIAASNCYGQPLFKGEEIVLHRPELYKVAMASLKGKVRWQASLMIAQGRAMRYACEA